MWLVLLPACKQIGFDLDVDLIPPDAPEVTEVAPAAWELSLYDERVDGELPAFLDTALTGPVLLADRVRHAEGDGFFTVTVSDVSMDVEGPLALTFALASDDGRWHALGDESGEASSAACTVEIEAGFDPDAHAADVLACLRARIAAAGAPAAFTLTVAAETADDDWEFHATYTLGTDRPVEASCTGKYALTGEVLEQAGSAEVELDDLTVAGYAAAGDAPMALVAFAGTWEDGGLFPVAGGSSTARVGAGEGTFVGREIEVAEDVPAAIAFAGAAAPVDLWPADYRVVAMDTLLAEGFFDTCEVRVHDALPNPAWVELALVGSGVAARK